MDYHGPMVQSLRFRAVALACAIAAGMAPALAQTPPQATIPAPPAEMEVPDDNSSDAAAALNAELFYELLLSEMTTSQGDPGTGYALMLDAARRSGDTRLYRRATEIALESRSAEYALIAARAWQQAQPQSRDANRYMLRILVLLNRVADTAGPLRQELTQAPTRDKISSLHSLPQLYARVSDKALAARVVEQAVADDLTHPAVGPVAWTTVGRLRLAASDKPGALQAVQRAQALDATDDGAAMLALQLLEDGVTEAEPLLTGYLAGTPLPEVRMAYARLLLESQRLSEAQTQVEAVTRERPDAPEAWLVQASLHLQAQQLDAAQTSLQRFMQLLDTLPASEQRQRALTQAYLMQAQIAEKRGDFPQAESWLARIDNASDLLGAQSRRASLLARQGKLDEALALIRTIPAKDQDDERLKLQAEAQLLRDAGQYQKAYEAQSRAAALAPQDNDLAYDRAMLAEKAGRTDEMESLLREIIARKPDYHHALNALGFSMADRGVRLQEAKALINKALEYAPEDPFITDSLGWVEFRLGNTQEALRLLETAFQKQPNAEVAAHLGEVLWTLGERERALAVWREGLRLDKDDTALQSTLKRLGARP
ncbi:lipopolysaccharide assembly protein LapB [Acidovorax sp. MR-S7]|uniref:tetratricopeptide repeat protein n=1 Tax=Acidovorax sp. MR-S7 TaxID=1268622 RepID=UPI00054F9811|nr:tetratricopeptide repeat protein [Acidovorax sp. MR-S7]